MAYDYDVIILGSGPAGFSCAIQSSKFAKRALIVEADNTHLGGTWINTGTMPSKALREAAKTILEFNTQFGGRQNKKPYDIYQMHELLQYKDKILSHENERVKQDLENNRVDISRGFGRIVDNHTVKIKSGETTHRHTAGYILVSTGSSPAPPETFEIDHKNVFDYKSILTITHIPRRLVIIGSGVLAMEYATIFAALGTRVSVLSDQGQELAFLDDEINKAFFRIVSDNIKVRRGIKVEKIQYNSLRSLTGVHFNEPQQDGRRQVIETEHVLYLGGRTANTQNIGLTEAGVQLDAGQGIITDEHYQTDVENIYAAGDVIGFPRLASASFTQGRQAACNMFNIPAEETSKLIPYGIYSIPGVAQIGLTEQVAREQNIDVTVGRAYFSSIAKANMTEHQSGMLKLVFNTETLKLLGVHIVGDEASNLIHLGQSVIAFGGDVRYFIQHVMNYPTLSEAYRIAAFNGLNRVYQAGVQYREMLEGAGNDM